MPDLDQFLRAVALEPVGPDRYGGPNMDHAGPVVFGGQILAQLLAAAGRAAPDKTVKSLHTVFARAVADEPPIQIAVETIHSGRSFASLSLSCLQAPPPGPGPGHPGERLCARGLALMEAGAHDVIRHGPARPGLSPPARGRPVDGGWWEQAVVGDVDLDDTGSGPAELALWSRFPGAGDDPRLAQQLLAYASDGFLIGTALRPHEGLGQSQAHRELETTVLTHTLSFHEPFSAADWLLLDQESPYAGRGRAYGRAHVFDAGGNLVASFTQESMIRESRPSP